MAGKSPKSTGATSPSLEAASPNAGPALPLPSELWANDESDDADSALGDDVATSTASITSSILKYRTVQGRTYHSEKFSDATYWGANDNKQQETLDIMHQAMTLSIDGRLHLAPLDEKSITKILDIGTGTGIWAIDFADAHPAVEVIGTDLSPIQPGWVSPNIQFQIDNYSEPWTFEGESFDYVHTRWLLGAVNDWTVLYKEAFKVLKPGGWVESFDFDGFAKCDDDTMKETHALAIWGSIFEESGIKLGHQPSFRVVEHGLMQKGMEEAGFINMKEEVHNIPVSEWSKNPKMKEIGLYWRASAQDVEGFMTYPASQLGWDEREISIYAAKLRAETRECKVHAYFPGMVVYAQKPFE